MRSQQIPDRHARSPFGWLPFYLLAFAAFIGLSQPAAAQLASKPAADWIKTLDASNRIARLKIDETIAKLKIKPGEIIADIGAGSGVFSAPLAKAASPKGKVFAVDIDQGLLDHIARRAKEQRVTNIQTVLGEFTDPNLPATNVSLAFIYDVLHHIEDRAGYLKNLARYLKRSGRIAVIDFHPELGPHKDDPALQVTREQTAAWMAAAGFKPVEEIHLFKDKWFIVYAR
jgi:ubiquinone/menaquinone biosynthesis C-methylase UbiE